MAATIAPLCEGCNLALKRSPLLRQFTNNFSTTPKPPSGVRSGSTPGKQPQAQNRGPKQAKATVITPTVKQIAEQLFNNPFRVVGEPEEADEVAEEIINVKEHNEDPTSIVWGTPAARNNNYYISAKIDGVEYHARTLLFQTKRGTLCLMWTYSRPVIL